MSTNTSKTRKSRSDPASDGAPRDHHPVDPQQQNRAEQRHEEAGAVVGAVPVEGAPDEAADQGSGNPQQHRDDEAARVPSRHQELCDGADNRAEQDPTQQSEHALTSAATVANRRPSSWGPVAGSWQLAAGS